VPSGFFGDITMYDYDENDFGELPEGELFSDEIKWLRLQKRLGRLNKAGKSRLREYETYLKNCEA
jgi:hypothetical protein